MKLKDPSFGSILLTVISCAVSLSSAEEEEGNPTRPRELSYSKTEIKISSHVIQHYGLIYFDF